MDVHFYKVNIHFFCILLDYFSNFSLLKLRLFKHNFYYNEDLSRNVPQNWQKVGIQFSENVLSEMNLPLFKINNQQMQGSCNSCHMRGLLAHILKKIYSSAISSKMTYRSPGSKKIEDRFEFQISTV